MPSTPLRCLAATLFLVAALTACSAGMRRPGGVGEGGVSDFGGRDAATDMDAGPTSDLGSVDDGGGDGGGPVRVDGGEGRTCFVTETCNNGLDDDCNGDVDEGCACEPGTMQACFRGDASARGVGICADGTMVCMGTGEFGAWTPCTGDTSPTAEVCDTAGLDEDCNGAINDGCECSDGDPDLVCGSDVGGCVAGVQRCEGGRRTPCTGATSPMVEVCNGIDDDCNGITDEGLRRSCGSAVGACRLGTETCAAGTWGTCAGGNPASTEVCDALDNDCNGVTDEGLSRSCGSAVGRCVAGMQECLAGTFTDCAGAVTPIAETCNGVDDDCNGMVDDGLSRACGSSVGICRPGVETCAAGTWGACRGGITAGAEVCDGVRDENCNGTVDESCGCIGGTMRACGSTVGVCRAGSQTCTTSGAWGACAGGTGPSTERCNGVDDNCNGVTDEGCDCLTGATRACGSTVGACRAGTQTCGATTWGPCSGAVGPAGEVCNMVDDDCNGVVDDPGTCPILPPGVMCPGARTTTVGAAISLSSSASDPGGLALSYAWTVITRPAGSAAVPTPVSATTTMFTADVAGDYTLRFCATNSASLSTCCTVTVMAASTCTPPTAPVISGCPNSWDRRPIVELPPLPTGIVYRLFKDADAVPYATVTTVGQNYVRAPTTLDVGGPPPAGTRVNITARACRVSDPTCCASSAPINVTLIESCTTPVPATASNIVFSEYAIDGDGVCPGTDCEAGEAVEITNLSNCPVTLDGNHFGYCSGTCTTFRWMDFTAVDVIPPRGVYVAIRNRAASMCAYPFFGPDDPSLFGLKISGLAMQGMNLVSGWFANTGGASTVLRVATGPWSSITGGTTLARISPYIATAPECSTIGFQAIDACGDVSAVSTPTMTLTPNELGRLWHPCDAVASPVPAGCRAM